MEVYVPFKNGGAKCAPVREVRSAMVVSAIQALRARSLYERYLENVSGPVRERIVSMTAGDGLFTSKIYSHLDRRRCSQTSVCYRVQWT
jgi:hypothetical protein